MRDAVSEIVWRLGRSRDAYLESMGFAGREGCGMIIQN
jgi:hypothetical protein